MSPPLIRIYINSTASRPSKYPHPSASPPSSSLLSATTSLPPPSIDVPCRLPPPQWPDLVAASPRRPSAARICAATSEPLAHPPPGLVSASLAKEDREAMERITTEPPTRSTWWISAASTQACGGRAQDLQGARNRGVIDVSSGNEDGGADEDLSRLWQRRHRAGPCGRWDFAGGVARPLQVRRLRF